MSATREPLQYRTKADLVYEQLREEILSGAVRPGQRVSISRVARDLGVSDIPAREGVKRLEADGLVSFTTHKGAVVARMGRHEVEELFAIRTELEALALSRAAERIEAAELARLREILNAMGAAARGGDVAAYGRLNRDFHMLAYAAQPYAKLRSMIEALWDSTDWCRRIFNTEGESMHASLAEHEAIYAALARADGDAAATALRSQKQRAAAWLLEHINEDADAPAPATA